MKIIGICGSSGSGKSTVCKIFAKKNIPVLDCDVIYHRLVNAPSDCLTEIGETFGKDLIVEHKLDRKKLGKIVFADRGKLELLNKISHRHVFLELQKSTDQFRAEGYQACVIDAPMLFEAKLDDYCDLVIAVVSEEEKQIERICLRDGICAEEAKKRLKNQIPAKTLKEKADFIIENNDTHEALELQSETLINTILNEKGESL